MLDPTTSLVHLACPGCGALELRPTALHVTVFVGVDARQVRFFCPGCTEEVVLPLSSDAGDFLVRSLRVGYSEVGVPAEYLEDKSGPMLTSDDVLDFVLALRQVQVLFADPGLPEELRVDW